jgi:hypothetical protein
VVSAARLDRVIDAYLDVWSDLGSRAELRALLEAACMISRINRAHSWRLVLSSVPTQYWGDFSTADSDWLLIAVEQASAI